MRTRGVGRPRWSAEAAFRPKPEKVQFTTYSHPGRDENSPRLWIAHGSGLSVDYITELSTNFCSGRTVNECASPLVDGIPRQAGKPNQR
jgi:hypothetical protein